MVEQLKGMNILSCKITVGTYDESSPILMHADYMFDECVNIEINDSYQTLINTAKITLTRDILISLSEKDGYGYRQNLLLTTDELESFFRKGMRIRVECGYDDNNTLLFDGFITSLEAKSPFTIYCEDFGWQIKRKTIYPSDVVTTRGGTKINDLLDKFLDGTGVTLHSLTRSMNIELGIVALKEPRTFSEILEFWKKNFGLLSFIKFENGAPTLALSRTYFSENKEQTLISGEVSNVDIIDFSENVVKDDLKFAYLDYNTLALEAVAIDKDNKKLKVTIIANPGYIGADASTAAGGLDKSIRETSAEYAAETDPTQKTLLKTKLDALNQRKDIVAAGTDEFLIKNKSTASKKQNKLNSASIENSFDMTHYNVRTYHAYNVNMETLIKQAKSVFKNISQTGVSGTVTLFGDFGLRSASMVRLFDARNPEKNGTYVVSEVRTIFGAKGYRQMIKIPFKRSN